MGKIKRECKLKRKIDRMKGKERERERRDIVKKRKERVKKIRNR